MARANYSTSLLGKLTFGPACGDHITSTYTPVEKTSVETTSGVSRRKPKGWLDPTAYTFEKLRTDLQVGTCEYYDQASGNIHVYGSRYVGVVGGTNGRFNGNSHFNNAMTVATAKNNNGLTNKALIAVRNNLKSSNVNLGIAFGERKRTANLLGSTAARLARSVRALKRGQIRRSMNELGISSSRREPRGSNVPRKWLELQYGWKPLLRDVYGAAKALEQRPKGDWRVTAKATRSQEVHGTYSVTPTKTAGFDGCLCRARAVQSVFARIDALPQNEATISLASLGVTNPLSVAWELVPWSFVVDWTIPIGSFLESLDAMLGYGPSSYSTSFLVKATWIDEGRSASGATWYNRSNFKGTRRLVYLKRDVSSSVPLPTLPRFKDPRSLGHMANGLALLATAFGRR